MSIETFEMYSKNIRKIEKVQLMIQDLSKLFYLLNGFSLKSTNDRFEVLQVHVIQEEMKDFPLVFMRIKQQTIKRKL